MSKLSTINTKIVLSASQANGELRTFNSNLNAMYSAFKGGAPQLQTFAKQTEITSAKLVGLKSNIDALNNSFSTLANFGKIMKVAFGGAYEYSTMMESNAIGISGILKSMVTLNGKTLEWNQAMGMSKNMMGKLRIEALQTAATSKDLIDTFRALLGPGLGAGMTIDEIMNFTTVGVNAVRSMGLPTNQFIQELRGLEQGGLRSSSSTLATALGISDKDIKAAKESTDGLYKFLMDRMKGFSASTTENSKTVVGRIAIIQEGLYTALEQSGERLFRRYSDNLKYIGDAMFKMNEETKKMELRPEFVSGVSKVTDRLEQWAGYAETLGKGLMSNVGGITQALLTFVAVKGATSILGSVVNGIERYTAAVSGVGRFLFGVEDAAAKYKAIYDEMNRIVADSELLVNNNRELSSVIANVDNGVKSLADHYISMGVSAEQAASMQKRIEDAIASGKSYEQIERMKKGYEEYAKTIQRKNNISSYLQEVKNHRDVINNQLQKEKDAIDSVTASYEKQYNVIQQKLSKVKQEIFDALEKQHANFIKSLDDNLFSSKSLASNPISVAEKRARMYRGNDAPADSLVNLDRELVRLGMTREEAEQRILELRERIISLSNRDAETMRNLVNTHRENLLEEAQRLGTQRHIAEVTEQEGAALERNINNRVRELELQERQRREAERAQRFLAGNYVHQHEETRTTWGVGTTQYERGQEINAALQANGLADADRYHYISQYMNRASRNSADAERYAQALISQAEAYGNAINRARTYRVEIQNVELQTNQYVEAARNAGIEQSMLWIDAANKLERYADINQSGASTINKAWEKLSNRQEAGFADQEKRIKTLIALQHELRSGNISVAENFSNLYLNALTANKNKTVDDDENVLKAIEKYNDLKEKQKQLEKKTQEEIAEIKQKTADVIAKETKAITDATNAYHYNKNAVQEVVNLSAEEINAKQREILMHEAKANAIKTGGDKAIQSIDKVIEMVRKEALEMEKAGLKETTAYKSLMGVLKALAQGTMQYNEQTHKMISNILSDIQRLENATGSLKSKVASAFGGMVNAAGGLAMAYQMCTNDTESNIGKMAEWVVQAGFVVSAIEGALPALEKMRIAYLELAKAAALSKLVQGGLIVGGSLLAIAGVAAIAHNVYDGNKKTKQYGTVALGYEEGTDFTYVKSEADILQDIKENERKKQAEILELQVDTREFLKNGSTNAQQELLELNHTGEIIAKQQEIDRKRKEELEKGKVDLIYPKGAGTDSNLKGADKEKKRLNDIREAQDGYIKLADTVNVAYSSLEMHNDKYAKDVAEAQKKIDSWQVSLENYLVKSGGVIKKNEDGTKVIANYGAIGKKAYDELTQKIKEYLPLKQQEIDLEKKLQGAKDDIQHVANLESMGGVSQERIVSMRRNALEQYRADLDEQIDFYKNNATERVQIEQELASVTKQIRDNNMYDFKTAWKATLEELSMKQINYGETIKNVFSSIESAGVNLLTSTESFGQRIKTFFSDIASSIMAEMSKLIMKALITNVLLKAFSGLFGGLKIPSNVKGSSDTLASYNIHSISQMENDNFLKSQGFGLASGGYASGWHLVGEEGPELVNFSHPGRVYNAQQTANALSGNGGNVNIKIDLKNESGQQLQAETTGSSFDGENYIVGVVLKAINTNKYGIRTTMKGLANA